MTFRREPLGLKPPKLTAAQRAEGKRHMARVAQLGCVICGARPVEVHHVIHGRYGQRKASDFDTIALCVHHHRIGPEAIHTNKAAWMDRWGPDHSYLARVAAILAGDANP